MREEFDAEADDLERDLPRLGSHPVSGLVRRARRLADLSQRQLARRAEVAPSTVGKVEAGRLMPSLDVLQRLLAAAGLHLVVVDAEGRLVSPMRETGLARDLADRRFPAHLDTILAPDPGEWWKDFYGFAGVPDTFHRDREHRDWLRAKRRVEARISYGASPPPPPPTTAERLRQQQDLRRETREARRPPVPPPPPIGEDEWDVDEWDPADLVPRPTPAPGRRRRARATDGDDEPEPSTPTS